MMMTSYWMFQDSEGRDAGHVLKAVFPSKCNPLFDFG